MEEVVEISKKVYDELVRDSEFLYYLQAAGVDNWEGYYIAIETMEEDEDNK